MYYDQKDYDIRCEWGAEGLSELLPGSRAIVIVDVLSFSTCVDIAVGKRRDGIPLPVQGSYRGRVRQGP